MSLLLSISPWEHTLNGSYLTDVVAVVHITWDDALNGVYMTDVVAVAHATRRRHHSGSVSVRL